MSSADAIPSDLLPRPLRRLAAPLSSLGVVIALGLLILVSLLAITSVGDKMTDHGASIADLQAPGSAERAEKIHNDYGEDGRRAAWWFLAFELPFLTSFGLLLSAACAFAASRLAEVGADRLARLAGGAVALGLLAAACDLVQNGAVAAILLGHTGQPAPNIAEYFGYLTWVFGLLAGAVFVVGWTAAMRRSSAPGEPRRSQA